MKKKSPPKRKANIPAFLKEKKISAQSEAYIKGYKIAPIKEAEVFKNAGIIKKGNRLYPKDGKNPFKNKATAKDYAAKQAGFSSYQKYLDTRKSKTYKQFEKRAREKGVNPALGKEFAKLYRDWQKVRYRKKSEAMRKLLKPLGWIDKYNYARYV